MYSKKYLIAGGNSTLICWDFRPEEQVTIIEKYLEEIEQIGFASVNSGKLPEFKMMGNEFSGNGTLAFAFTLGGSGFLRTSGISEPVKFTNLDGFTSIEVPITYNVKGNIVLLEGIGYLCTDKDIDITKDLLKELADKYRLPAFGIALFKEAKLTPYVYVKETNSLVKETACGSGSIATYINTGESNIIQPSGETISIVQKDNKFELTAKVTLID